MKNYSYLDVKIIINNLGYLLIDNEYKNSHTRLTICDTDGFYYYVPLYYLLNKRIPQKFHTSNPYTLQNIKLWCKLNNKPFELISNVYINSESELKWQCTNLQCHEIFYGTWNNMINAKVCPYCIGQKVNLLNCLATKNPELVKEWHPTKNGNLTPYDVTANSNKEIWWQCLKNLTHEWLMSVSVRNKGYNCPFCSGHKVNLSNCLAIKNPELASEWHPTLNDELTPYDVTCGSNKQVWWLCKECGHEWKTYINNRNRGYGCSVCNESKGEKVIRKYFEKNNIVFIGQHEFVDLVSSLGNPLKFDFAVFSNIEKTKLKLLIEYDGEFHYLPILGKTQLKTQKIRDELKNEYCNKNNIRLLRIPYWNFNNIEEILGEEVNYAVKI